MAALQHGSRKFYDIPSENLQYVRHDREVKNHKKIEELFKYIENSCIGKDLTFTGPYGLRKVIYCDYTASGRSLSFIEDYIQEQVLPHYGNTHTTTTVTSLQTTLYRHEARYAWCIFVGNGVTGGVHKLIHALDLKKPPVVFVGPFEHHSNLLPWKEIGAKVVWIKQDLTGQVDLSHLEMKLKLHSPKGDTQLIGCFSAASNVTGILTDTNAVTACLHRYDALAFWDYATAGPYVEINMNPFVTSEQGLVHKDAIFVSTHKFVGGVQTPGILVAKKKLFENPVPSGCGGGSVFFVCTLHNILQKFGIKLMVTGAGLVSDHPGNSKKWSSLELVAFKNGPSGITFELGAVTVDPQSSGYDPRPLIPYLNALGVPYFFEEQGIIEQAAKLTVCESICSFCSRMKRGRLYACARREGYNVLAMGQHLDDLAESFLMSAFHNGLLRTMKANYTVMEGDLRVIRPFVYVREKDLRSFAEKVKLPVIAENCPACFEAPKISQNSCRTCHIVGEVLLVVAYISGYKCICNTITFKGITFELGAVTVDPQSSGYDPRPLIPYLNALGVPYFFEEQGIIEQAAKLTVCESICSFCSRMKRGRLYACARREGYNVLAMGQHLDDLAESFLMSAFHNGLLRTMKANYTVMEGDLRVIRPFVYVREKDLRSFAEKVKLPVIAENCPACFEAPKERHRTKQLLAAQEILFPDLYNSLLTAMKPLMARDRVGLESSKMKKGNYEDFL
ncbi:PREDICTED: uncharacterized protein LOC107343660 [Acropora digitifera]|uniref:uncharacterized protein LOC107343660 n=1 Tax=Acropora digitifera TaxID=70779 RepID=UPI00077A4172|nr:PREDICTED: uncharacterized protein LOC107343660 [Acropora digitifera]